MLADQFEILVSYDLLRYDHDMRTLYHDLRSWLDQRFQGREVSFEPHQRIVFWYNDVDYYVHPDFPGFTLYNLQVILKELDISNYFCAVSSATQNLEKYTQLAKSLLTTDDFAIGSACCYCAQDEFNIGPQWTKICPDRSLIKYQDTVKMPFIVPARRQRIHRTYFMAQLQERHLQDRGLVSYHNFTGHQVDSASYSPIHDCPCEFLSAVPFTRNNSNMVLTKEKNREIINQFPSSLKSFSNFPNAIDITDYSNANKDPINAIQQSLVYVALETVVNYPEPYVSFISLRSIPHKRPFLIFGPARQLAYLKEWGFKTFDQFWDEGYDTITNIEDRADAILNILETLSSMSQTQLNHMLQEMQPILEHNLNHYLEHWPKQQLEKFYQGLQR